MNVSDVQHIILERLLLAPLQSCEDLTLLTGMHRTSVYRHLEHLADQGMIDVITPHCIGPRNARLVFLTPRGILALAEGDAARAHAIGHAYGVNLTGLARLLPRLPALHTLQALFPRLLAACDIAMRHTYDPTTRTFQWSWRRHYHLHFQVNAAMYEVWVDGLFTTHVTVTGALAREGIVRDQLYYVAWLLLDPGVGEVALVRRRLRGLVKLRETPMYWQQRDAFPPIYIQAASAYRASLWRQAIYDVCAQEHVGPLRGVIEIRSPASEDCWPPRAGMSPPVRLTTGSTYLALETGIPTTLEALFLPDLPAAAVTPYMAQNGAAPMPPLTGVYPLPKDVPRYTSLSSRLLTKSIAAEKLVAKHASAIRLAAEKAGPMEKSTSSTSKPAQHAHASTPNVARIGGIMLDVTRRQLGIVDMIAAHPLIEEGVLADVLDQNPKKLRDNHLQPLFRQGLLERTAIHTARIDTLLPPSHATMHGSGLFLTPCGWHVLEALYHQHHRLLTGTRLGGFRSDKATQQQQKEAFPSLLVRHSDHTTAIYRFFAQLLCAAATQQVPEHLLWWETGIATYRVFQSGPEKLFLRPDGIGEYHWPHRRMRFWLEIDMGTMQRHELYEKLKTYALYARSSTIKLEYLPSLPTLFIVTSNRSQEEVITGIITDLLIEDHLLGNNGSLVIRTTTFADIIKGGVLGPIWLNQIPPPPVRPINPGGPPTRSLHLTDAIPPRHDVA